MGLDMAVFVDSSRFNQAMRGIQAAIKKPMRDVIKSEAGSILKQCAGDTKVMTQERADVRSRNSVTHALGYSGGNGAKADHPITINSGRRGEAGRVFLLKKNGAGFRRTHNANFSAINQHYTDTQWRDIKDAIADVKAGWSKAVAAGRKSIGLSRQSWVQIADNIGIRLENVPGGGISGAGLAKARKAIAKDGIAYQNGFAHEFLENNAFVLELTNRLPWGRKLGLDAILARRMNGRAGYFEQNMRRGVFDSVQKTLRAYPGFKVNAA